MMVIMKDLKKYILRPARLPRGYIVDTVINAPWIEEFEFSTFYPSSTVVFLGCDIFDVQLVLSVSFAGISWRLVD
jgi:hypothetical protein